MRQEQPPGKRLEKLHVGIQEERGEVILRWPLAGTLEVYDVEASFLHNEVSGLEIPVEEEGTFLDPRRPLGEARELVLNLVLGDLHAEGVPEEALVKISEFPLHDEARAINRGIETLPGIQSFARLQLDPDEYIGGLLIEALHLGSAARAHRILEVNRAEILTDALGKVISEANI